MTEELDVPPAPPAKRRRRGLRRLVLALALAPVIAIIGLVLIIVTLPRWITPERVRVEAIAAAKDFLHVDVDIAQVDYDLAWGIELRGIRIGPPAGFTRDVLQVEQIALRYALPWDGVVVIQKAVVTRPHAVIETVNGVKNIEALFPPGEPKPKPEPAEPAAPDEGGPLSPITLVLERVAVERAWVELVGEGPQASIDGLTAVIDARIDPSKLHARLAITSTQAPVRAVLPDRTVATALDLEVYTTIDADVHDGIALETFDFDADISLVKLDVGERMPPMTVRLRTRAMLHGQSDRFAVQAITLFLDGREIACFKLEVEGVIALLADAVGDRTLAALLGLVPSSKPGVVKLHGPGITLALQPLMPLVHVFAPDLTLGGEVRLVLEGVEGRLPELMMLRPQRAAVTLELDQLTVRGPADVGALDGAISLTAAGLAPLQIEGNIRGERLRSGPNSVEALELAIGGSIERPQYPQTGTASIAVKLALTGVRAPGARVSKLKADLSLGGRDPLDPARAAEPPVRVSLATTIEGIHTETGTISRDVGALTAKIEASIDRLLAPALRPIAAQIALNVRNVRAPEATVGALDLVLAVKSDDPRHGRPIAASVDGNITVGRARAPQAVVDKATLRIRARASGVDVTGNEPLPATATIDTTLDIPELEVTGTQPIKAPVRVDADLDFVREGQVVTVRALRVRAAETLDLVVAGLVQKALTPRPNVDVKVTLAPLDLGKPVLAQAMSEPFEGHGQLGFTAKMKGTWTGLDDLVARLDAPPFEAAVELNLRDVGLKMRARDIAIEHLDGTVAADLSRGRTGTRADLKLGHASSGAQRIDDLSAKWAIGLDEGVWRARAHIEAAKLGDGRAQLEAAVVDIDIAHPPFGDVDVRKLVIHVPGAGLDAELGGRLARARFGAVRPDLALTTKVDLERLRQALSVTGSPPEALRGISGKVGFDLAATSPSPSLLRVDGAVTLDGFGYNANGTQVVNATGRVPFSQLLVIGAPDDRVLGTTAASAGPLAESWSGLEASLEQLRDILVRQSRIVLAPEDVLVVSPRTADYEALRPYYRAPSTARLTIERIEQAQFKLENLSMDIAYRAGVVRLDRFSMRLWGGDIYGELAIQIADQDHLRLRFRSTLTNLNLDMPVAMAMSRQPIVGPDSAEYLVSGNLDLRMDLRDRSINGYFDFTKMGSSALVGLIDALDPAGKDKGLQATRSSIATFAVFGNFTARLAGTIMSIRNNLLDLDLVWEYQPFELTWWSLLGANVFRLLIGPIVMNSVAPNKDISLSHYLEGPWVKNLNRMVFVDAIRGRLLVEDEAALAQKDQP